MENLTENILRSLIELNMERAQGYQAALTHVSHPGKRRFLSKQSSQSEGFITELAYFLNLYGGSIEGEAHEQGVAAHLNFELSQSDQAIFLVLLERETKVIANYNQLLTEGIDLDNTLFEKIRAQKSELMESEEKLSTLKDQ